jgi:class 3 adenylate cyclase
MGINLGPVKLVKDINGHPNIIGDGINVAQRIMSFARPGQIVVSRSYYDVVSNLASEYAKLFSYEGSRTDKHVREHEIYVVGHHEGACRRRRTA